MRHECEKTQIEVFVPKWTVGGAGSSPEAVVFDSAIGKNCRGSAFNKTHYYLNIDLLDPKRDCGTKRKNEGIQGIFGKIIFKQIMLDLVSFVLETQS